MDGRTEGRTEKLTYRGGSPTLKNPYVTKSLGVFIDKNLSWKQYIGILSSKISKSIDILYKSRDVLSKQCLKQLHE